MYVDMDSSGRTIGPGRPPHSTYSPDDVQSREEPFPRLSSDGRDFGPNMSGGMHSEKWLPRRGSRAGYSKSGSFGTTNRHGRQKSLSEAINIIRTRKGSMSQNAHEIADALKAPVSPMLVVSPRSICRFVGMLK